MKRLYLLLGVLISALFMWSALASLDLATVWEQLQSAQYGWLIPGVAAYFLAVWARTWRWDYMLRPLKQIPLRRLFPVVVIGYMGNNIYPFRAGELLRAYVLRQREEVPVSASLATVIVERVFDGLVMLLFVFVALPFAPLPSPRIRTIVIFASLAFFAATLLFFTLAAFPDRARRAVRWLGMHLLPGRLRTPLFRFTTRFLEGLASLRHFSNVVMLFATSILIWLLETVKYWFVMHAFPFQVSFFALMLMNGVVNLATTLPSAPGYVGTFDKPGIDVLRLYQVGRPLATAYTLVLHAALWLPITLLGAAFMLREGLGWADFARAASLAGQKEAAA